MLGFEHGNKVLVAELIYGSIGFDVVLILLGSLNIHISWIPFIGERRNRVESPMDKDSELCVFVPIRDFILLQGLPVRTEWTFLVTLVHIAQKIGALAVVFSAGFLPSLIDSRWIFRGGRRSGILRIYDRWRECGQRETTY